MKKEFLLTVTLLAAFIAAEAQKPDTAQVLVHYKFTHIKDTTNREHPYTENMVLFVGTSASAYESYDAILANERFKKEYEVAIAGSPDGNVRVNRHNSGSRTEYFQFPNEKKFFTKEELMFNAYLIEEPTPTIDWKISSDTATFGGLRCQKATAHFKGRDYIAWFSPDLPMHTGPWKLNGLPGVIVDAHDATNTVVFKFDGVEKAPPSTAKSWFAKVTNGAKDYSPILRGLDEDHNLIVLPSGAVNASKKDFDKLRERMEKDPAAFAQAMNASQHDGDGPKMDNIRVAPGRHPGPVINNPIELPEKK